MCIALDNIDLLLYIREVFAVFDRDAVVCAPVFVELDLKVIKLILAAPYVEDRALASSEESAHGARLFDRGFVERRYIGADGEIMCKFRVVECMERSADRDGGSTARTRKTRKR